MHEKISEKGKEKVAADTRDAVRPVVRDIVKKLEGAGFRKEDIAPAIRKGLDDAKGDV